jgi:hypothetical protein
VLESLQRGRDKCVRASVAAMATFAHHRNDRSWETLAQRRKVARVCVLFGA